MPPAAKKSPVDYLVALVISSCAIFGSFVVEPAETRWIVFGCGVFMCVAVIAAALRPLKS